MPSRCGTNVERAKRAVERQPSSLGRVWGGLLPSPFSLLPQVRRWRGLLPSPFSLLTVLSACAADADTALQQRADSQAPPFDISGVIEGFYGTPWSHEDRQDMLRFMGRVGLNAYVYAPKNDPYHRGRWREPYPETERNRLGELVSTAQTSGVTFWYAISPGLTMAYSDADDYTALLSKIERVAELGVRHFGLFLDDVPTDLAHDADRAVYPSLADAHVDLINKLHGDLVSRGFTLSVTPTTYTDAWGDREYIERIGSGVDSSVPLFWTGPDVATSEITVAQADRWGEFIGRKPLIWDNYPVNDYARWRLFLGPFTGRARGLSRSVAGIISNPMNEAHASMISLSTLADYVKDPQGYDPDRSLHRALESLYGTDGARRLEPFMQIYGDYAWDVNLFESLYFARNTIELGPVEAGVRRLEAGLTELREAAEAGNEAIGELLEEIAPFVQQTKDRIAELKDDSSYELRESRLVYRDEYDRVRAEASSSGMSVDGDLSDWMGAIWRSLHGPRRSGVSPVRAAFRTDDRHLYIGLDVPYSANAVREGSHMGEGDHIAMVLDSDPSDDEISPRDLFVFLVPPTGRAEGGVESEPPPLIRSMEFTGFMSKFLADNRAFTFNEFYLSTFTRPPHQSVAAVADGIVYRARRAEGGYHAEIALPHGQRDRLRISLTVAVVDGGRRVFSLSRRNYPASPATFSEVVLR